MTRGGVVDARKEQRGAAARRHGLGRATEVLIVTDGGETQGRCEQRSDHRIGALARAPVEQEQACRKPHLDRLDYGTAKKKGEPLGSGTMASTRRQDPVRFQRTGPFWNQTGAEALMGLDTCRRNGRWAILFPHARPIDPARY